MIYFMSRTGIICLLMFGQCTLQYKTIIIWLKKHQVRIVNFITVLLNILIRVNVYTKCIKVQLYDLGNKCLLNFTLEMYSCIHKSLDI